MADQNTKWRALLFLSIAQFMLVVDDTVVNVALPTIQRELQLTAQNLVWVVNGYILPFGGILLLGGRLADLYGRRKLFLLGVSLFTLASALNGAAWTSSVLLASRVLQGVGAALVAPAGLALVATLFDRPEDRAKALGIWGGLQALGLTVGVLLSGILTAYASWRWIFYVNVPFGLLAIFGVRALVAPSEPRAQGAVDLVGGVTVTGGLGLLLLFLLRLKDTGVEGGAGVLAGAVALLVIFVIQERRAPTPMVPLKLLTSGRVVVANLLAFTIPAAFFAMFFLLTLHMQRVLKYSPLQAGLAYLGFAFPVMFGIGLCTKLVLRYGARVLLTAGMAISAVGLIVFGHLTVDGTYLREILPGMVLLGVGGGWSMVTVTIFALGNVPKSESGLASGLLNASQQLGGAVGLAILVSVAYWRSATSGAPSPELAQLTGSQAAFYLGAAISAVAAMVAAISVPSGLTENVDPTLAAAPES